MADLVIAAPEDAERITRFIGDRMYPEMALGFAPWDGAAARHTIDNLLRVGRTFLLIENGEIVGALGLESRKFWWSSQEAIGDLFFFIAPGHRSGFTAKRLVQAAVQTADTAGLPLILGGFGSPRLSPLNRFFRLLRFSEIGSLFLWRKDHG